jgi:hypothetical protein
LANFKQGVTHDGEPQSIGMSEPQYEDFVYNRYDCVNEKTGEVEVVTQRVFVSKYKTTKYEYYNFVEKTFADLLTLIKSKNADYTAGADDAFANFRRAEPVVPMLEATWVRWGDKIQRVDAYFRNGKLEVANEGLEDALLDVIGYSMIMLGELKEKKNA